MPLTLCLDLLIPGAQGYTCRDEQRPSAEPHPEQHLTDEEIRQQLPTADRLLIAVADQYWITKPVAIPASGRVMAREIAVFETGASLSDTPDDFVYLTVQPERLPVADLVIVSALRRSRAAQLIGSLVPSHRHDQVEFFPRSVALASGWLGKRRGGPPTILASLHHGLGEIMLIADDELLFHASLRVRAPRASQFPAAAALELATMLAGWSRRNDLTGSVQNALTGLGRCICFGDLDTEQVRSELVNRLSLVVESGSVQLYPPLPLPMRTRDSWLVATGMLAASAPPTERNRIETVIVREEHPR